MWEGFFSGDVFKGYDFNVFSFAFDLYGKGFFFEGRGVEGDFVVSGGDGFDTGDDFFDFVAFEVSAAGFGGEESEGGAWEMSFLLFFGSFDAVPA